MYNIMLIFNKKKAFDFSMMCVPISCPNIVITP